MERNKTETDAGNKEMKLKQRIREKLKKERNKETNKRKKITKIAGKMMKIKHRYV